MRKYNLAKEIIALRRELIAIANLRKTLKTEGWLDVVRVFNDQIGKYYQDVFDKCDKPRKNEIEIMCKKMVAEALGSILSALDSRVQNEEFVKNKLLQKEQEVLAAQDRADLAKL